MTYQLRYSPEAIRDMETVWQNVLDVSSSYDVADRYVSEFADEISKIKFFPKSGIPMYYRGLFTGFYSVNFKEYKAFYRLSEQCIEVIRIIFVRRDYMKILFESSSPGGKSPYSVEKSN